MSRQSTPILTLSVVALAALNADRFVTATGAVPAAGASAHGVGRAAAATGQRTPVDVLGTTVVEAERKLGITRQVIAVLSECRHPFSIITKSAGVTLGRLAPGEVATAAGQFVEVILLPANA